MDIGFEKIAGSPEELLRECDAVHFEHADFRKGLEFTRPALEAGKPVFYDRPFAWSIADAEEIIRLAKACNAPVMGGSSLEQQPEVLEMQRFAREEGPVRSYEAFCPEPVFSWMFPHDINYAHAGLGGGIESAYFSGDYFPNPNAWALLDDVMRGGVDLTKAPKGFRPDYKKKPEYRPAGSAVSVLTYKSRDGQPPMLGINLSFSGSITGIADLPAVFSVGEPYPNPFNPSTSIEFTLPSAERVSLTVFDITGRKVRDLVSGPLSAGSHTVSWDGRDENGREISSGVYIARIIAGQETASRKMSLLR